MKKLTIAALLLSAACATAPQPEPEPVTAEPGSSATLAEMQVSMTELLERLDVLGDRISRIETAQSEQRPVVQPPTASRPSAPRETATAATAAPRSANVAVQPAVRGAQIATRYREALALFGKNQFSDARTAFQEVFDSDSTGELADNALFWIGETYYSAGDYNNAIRFYRRVTAEFSDQNKAPDALFKTALALARSGDLALAKTTLQQVIERYPYSTSAPAARRELERIRF